MSFNAVTDNYVEIFADGACKGNPGPGGWGAILRYKNHEKEIFGGKDYTTNNQMELQAVISALEILNKSCKIKITTDSQYVNKGITQWINKWEKNNWLNASRRPVKNADLWQHLSRLAKIHQIDWYWIKGHSGHKENERADYLANLGIPTSNRLNLNFNERQ